MTTAARKQKANSIARRAVLWTIGSAVGGATIPSGLLVEPAVARGESDSQKRKARYQPNAPDVQNFYRVNRYPQ